jgi:threonine/homoserine/homoserine lactone efflux protein
MARAGAGADTGGVYLGPPGQPGRSATAFVTASDLYVLVRGAALGFSIAAPVGPIGVLCIRRTLAGGRDAGVLSGLGAATADAIYAAVAAFGLTCISSALTKHQLWLRAVGGLFLLYLGARIFIAKPPPEARVDREDGLLGAYLSTLFLTLTNPVTVLFFAAVFSGLALVADQGGYARAALLVLGVFLGSGCWWVILAAVVGASRSRFSLAGLRWANRVAGMVILGFGAAALLSLGR